MQNTNRLGLFVKTKAKKLGLDACVILPAAAKC